MRIYNTRCAEITNHWKNFRLRIKKLSARSRKFLACILCTSSIRFILSGYFTRILNSTKLNRAFDRCWCIVHPMLGSITNKATGKTDILLGNSLFRDVIHPAEVSLNRKCQCLQYRRFANAVVANQQINTRRKIQAHFFNALEVLDFCTFKMHLSAFFPPNGNKSFQPSCALFSLFYHSNRKTSISEFHFNSSKNSFLAITQTEMQSASVLPCCAPHHRYSGLLHSPGISSYQNP